VTCISSLYQNKFTQYIWGMGFPNIRKRVHMADPTHQVLFQWKNSLYDDHIIVNNKDGSFVLKYLFPKRSHRFSLSTSAPTIVCLSDNGIARSIHGVINIENHRDHAVLHVYGNYTESQKTKCDIISDFIGFKYTVDATREGRGVFKLIVDNRGRVETL
jgi:hypothetical protein